MEIWTQVGANALEASVPGLRDAVVGVTEKNRLHQVEALDALFVWRAPEELALPKSQAVAD